MTVLINNGRTYPLFARYTDNKNDFLVKLRIPNIFSVLNRSNITPNEKQWKYLDTLKHIFFRTGYVHFVCSLLL